MSVRIQITKILSPNDTGETGAHQAGILIPKNPPEILRFFPQLDSKIENPRIRLVFTDLYGKRWIFNFIYYNNKYRGGTRNEYRLTSMTPFIKQYDLHAGDEITFSKNKGKNFQIGFIKKEKILSKQVEIKLKLQKRWRVVPLI